MFDLSFFKIAVLAVIALVVFGPDQLPRMAIQAGKVLRDIRRYADGARADLQQYMPDEFKDLDLNELNPKYFVRKHLMDEVGSTLSGTRTPAANAAAVAAAAGGIGVPGAGTSSAGASGTAAGPGSLTPGEQPPWDSEAT